MFFIDSLRRFFRQRSIKKQVKSFKLFLEGNHETLENEVKESLVEAFSRWLLRWSDIYNQATQNPSKNQWYSFTADIVPQKPGSGWVLVEEGIFTEYSPLVNGMSMEFALCDRLTDVIVLLDLYGQGKVFNVHLRNQLLNVPLSSGIVFFDLYTKR